MHAVYLPDASRPGQWLSLPDDEARHAVKVLRLRDGDPVCALDGRGRRFSARLALSGGEARVCLLEELPGNEPGVRVTLYQGLPKADKLETIAQKLTELGGSALVPVKMERCVVRSDAKDAPKRRERLERIAREAAKQCQRARAPEISEPVSWGQALERMRAHDIVIVPWEEASGRRMKDLRREVPDARDIGIVIGPEGGMSAAEVDALTAAGAKAVTLGPRILRTETAAVAGTAMAMTLWGDL